MLSNKTAIITGAGRGIGKAFALRFAAEGASLVLSARSRDELHHTVREIEDVGGRAIGFVCDVSQPHDVQELIDTALRTFGAIDILLNNAGVQGEIGLLHEVQPENWKNVIGINLLGTCFCMSTVLPHMIERRKGKIVNLSGGGATSPRVRFSAYAASKAAVVRLTETVAEEMKEFSIDVNAIAPGAINTRMTREVIDAGLRSGAKEFHEAEERWLNGGHTPERAVELALFLASDASDGITGKLLSAPWDPWDEPSFQQKLREHADFATLRRIDNKTFFKKS